ncbi:LPS-assembly protein LptD [Aquabacterium lacunae]|uniref:LPS-assembly protein LptD n=1 Tax=Aquabacterium lacunae TaxID=2528630 RepID=A0A4Q9GX66_9BURK|nr:LPS assembly protein LptD [Aquabacterium lacunae]TBO29414.1 LPS-assembly protein LptD [Aquabacterium lacunae]
MPRRRTPVALAVAWCLGTLPVSSLQAQSSAPPAASKDSTAPTAPTAPGTATVTEPTGLRIANTLSWPVGGSKEAEQLPIHFEADRLEGSPDDVMKATGDVRLTRGDLIMRADQVTHRQADNSAQAEGHVRVMRRGDVFTGPSLNLKLDSLEGEFTSPIYRFARTDAGGQAARIEFLGPNRLRAVDATYSSCTSENTAEPDWVLETGSVLLDQETAEGVARNAVVRFKGVPILAAPVLSFPLNDARKSGLLPPSFDYDSKNGFEYSQPYYLNIAPERDATLTPTLSTRRGLGLDAEYRYLAPRDAGTVKASVLPNDRVAQRTRGLLDVQHQGNSEDGSSTRLTSYDVRIRRVSDDDYWKDFPRTLNSNITLTPRLLGSQLAVERQVNARAWGLGGNQATLYGKVQNWQSLKDLDTTSDVSAQLVSPYQREPQLGLRARSASESGLVWALTTEFNRFTNADSTRVSGNRAHALGQVERRFGSTAWYLTPRLSLNAANYTLDNNAALGTLKRHYTRSIPTASVEGGLVFERDSQWFGKGYVQTLEPRVQYVRTPYRDQSGIPLFDSAARDFNSYSIYSENAFTGVDRVSDANLVSVGVMTRLLDPVTAQEAMRLGVVQKVQFSDQRVTPNNGAPITQRLSDLLLVGSTSVLPRTWLDTTVQYSAQNNRVERSTTSVRVNAGPWRNVALSHLFSRDSSEQIDFSWQVPLSGRTPRLDGDGRVAKAVQTECRGSWYSVGKVSYSMVDKRISSSVLGFEYDGGCWIGRIVADQSAIGTTNSTRILFQLELIGLSRLGTSALKTLSTNVGGYRPLRDESSTLIPGASSDFHAYDD